MPKKCTICGKPLAEMNKEDRCFCHQEGMVIHEHTPVSLCTSWNPTQAPAETPSPGDDGYNEMAFTKDIVGAIDEDGQMYEVDLGNLPAKSKSIFEADTIIDETEV